MPLTASQRRHLRALAHHLEPVVLVGGHGVTPGVVQAVNEALAARELIKVRIDGERAVRSQLAETLAARTQAEIAQSIGRVIVLFRPARDRGKRQIILPAG